MKRYWFILSFLLVISPSALALDGEYVVMGGFSTIVNAFTRLKLIFNDNQYSSLVTAFVVMGMISALLLRSAKVGMEFLDTGKAQMGMGWLGLTVVGTIVYFGLVQPKGTIHIYDQTRNQYQAVSGIPDFLILTASVTNQVYQAFVDMGNRDTATTTRFTGEGTPIKMLMGILNRNGAQFDPYLSQNVRTMWNQCAPVAETRGFDTRSLKAGSSVLDVVSALAPLRNQAVYTNWISPSNPGGISMTCDQAYVSLKSDLGNPAAYGARLSDICAKNGYLSTNPMQMVECKSRMEEGLQTIFGASGLSLNTAMSNILVSQAITDAMLENNPDVAATLLTNRAMINGGVADAITNPEWLSFIMAGVIAIILTMTPLLLLLCFTPLLSKALTLLFGLWIFITSWQIADALLLQAGTDEILTAMNDIKSMGLGIDAVQMGPSSTMKAMSVMASARETALNIAMLVAGLFGVSAYGLSAFGQKAMSRLDRVTEETSDKAFTPEGKGAVIDAMSRGHATLQTAADVGGIERMSSAGSFSQSANIESGIRQIQSLGGSPGMAAQRTGAVEGGRAAGSVRGYENGNVTNGYEAAAESSMIQAQSTLGEMQGVQNSASASGMTVTEQSAQTSAVNHTMQSADARSNLQHGGGNLTSLGKQQGELHGTEREMQLGQAAGTRQAAASTGNSVAGFSQEKTATSAITEHASGQGQLQASGGSLEGLHSRAQYTASAESDERQGHASALHNSYDSEGGITSGISASQTEQMTQNLHDMREQKQNVWEISVETGKSESESRELLAASRSADQMGALQGNDYSARQMQENTAWSTRKGANIIEGEKTAFDKRGMQMPEYAKRHGETDMQQSISGQEKFNTLSSALKGDKQASDALVGANTNLAVNHEDAANLKDDGLITPTQAATIPEQGVGTVHMSMRETPEGKAIASSNVQAGNSATIDNGYSENNGQSFGSPVSAQQNLQHAPSIERLIAASESAAPGSSSRILGTEVASSLKPFIHQTGDGRTQQSIEGGASIGRSGLIKQLGKALGVTFNGAVNMNDISGRATVTDQIASAATHKIEQFRQNAVSQADTAKLTGETREQFINQNVAIQSEAFYKPLLKAAQETADAQSSGSVVSDVSMPRPQQPATEAQPNSFTRSGAGSPGEYAQQLKQNTASSEPALKPTAPAQIPPAPSQNVQTAGFTGSVQQSVAEPRLPGGNENKQMTTGGAQNAVQTEVVAPNAEVPQQPPVVPNQQALSGSTRNAPKQSHEEARTINAEETPETNSLYPPVSGRSSGAEVPLEGENNTKNKNVPQ